jgi:predicted ATPase/DNA-binding CsgD family transcriptional regulator
VVRPVSVLDVQMAAESARVRGLPDAPSLLLGRAAEAARLTELLTGSRLVTVVGAGGVGKTALAVDVARRLAPSFPDGAAFVGLADLDDPELVGSEIARRLDLIDVSGTEPTERLVAALRSLRMLLVVDNFEHLVEAAPLLAAVIAECPEVTLLVTSRRRLGVTAEHVLALSPLAVPAADAADPGGAASVALFCDRAAAVSSGFHPERPDLKLVGELCRLVDGLPLAIELIASHVRLLPPDALLARLQDADHGLGLLKGGPVDAATRHRDLRRTIAWSVDLLGAAAARLLSRLSVFREGWTLEAMEDVCCWDFTAGDAFDALIELVDLHLVEPVDLGGGEGRFRLLETVRRFATEALTTSGELGEVRDRHAQHFVSFAVGAGARLQGNDEHRWAARIDRELPNLRAALHHLAATGHADDGLTAAAALGPYWLDRGPIREGRQWIERFLTSATRPLRVRAIAEGWTARLALEQGEISASRDGDERDDRLRWARDVLDREGDVTEWLRLTDHLANVLHLQGRFAEADRVLVEALERSRTPETEWLRVELLVTRAVNAQDSGGLGEDDVLALFEEAVRAARLAHHDRASAGALGRMLIMHPPDPAVVTEARAEIDKAYHLSQTLGDRRNAARSAVGAAVLALVDRDPAAAAAWFVRGLDVSVAIGYWHGVAWSVMGTAGLAARAGRLVEGARLHGALRAQLDVISKETPHIQISAYYRLVQLLRDGLGDEFEVECRAGEARAWTETIAEARRIAAEVSGDARLATPRQPRRRGPRANPELTGRELDVLGALVAGRTNQQIAVDLGLSPKTVMHHTVSVYRKLAVRGRAEAVAHALRTGLVAS